MAESRVIQAQIERGIVPRVPLVTREELLGTMREIDYAERNTNFDIAVVGRTYTDIEGFMLTVPPQTSPYYLESSGVINISTGTAANGSSVTVLLAIVDADTSASWAYTAVTQVQTGTVSIPAQHPYFMSRRIQPHTTERRYKVQARLSLDLPAGWGTVGLLATDAPTQGLWPPAYFKAVRA